MFEGRIREVGRPDRILSYFGQEKAVLLVVTVTGILYNLGMGAGPYFEGQLAQCLYDIYQGEATAGDMARLAACAVKNETLVRLCSTRSVTVGGRTMTNHNRLLRSIDGCIGLKTGYTRAAGRTLVSCVRRNGRTLVAVTLQDGNDWADHAALYEFGFGP